MIIGVSGKIGSGKDTVGKIIQYLTRDIKQVTYSFDEYCERFNKVDKYIGVPDWQIKKFADTLKDIVCLLIGCTKEQLEDHEFKNTELGKEWKYWKVVGFNTRKEPMLGSYNMYSTKEECFPECSGKNIRLKKSIEEQQTIWTYSPCEFSHTPRILLQILGTDCGRKLIHPNIWINSLFSKYLPSVPLTENYKIAWFANNGQDDYKQLKLNNKELYQDLKVKMFNHINSTCPNWVITDVRFPNELKAIKDRQGISIRVNRIQIGKTYKYKETYSDTYSTGKAIEDNRGYDYCVLQDSNGMISRLHDLESYEVMEQEHESETTLDQASFDYIVDNNGTIEELIEKVKEILIKERILC